MTAYRILATPRVKRLRWVSDNLLRDCQRKIADNPLPLPYHTDFIGPDIDAKDIVACTQIDASQDALFYFSGLIKPVIDLGSHTRAEKLLNITWLAAWLLVDWVRPGAMAKPWPLPSSGIKLPGDPYARKRCLDFMLTLAHQSALAQFRRPRLEGWQPSEVLQAAVHFYNRIEEQHPLAIQSIVQQRVEWNFCASYGFSNGSESFADLTEDYLAQLAHKEKLFESVAHLWETPWISFGFFLLQRPLPVALFVKRGGGDWANDGYTMHMVEGFDQHQSLARCSFKFSRSLQSAIITSLQGEYGKGDVLNAIASAAGAPLALELILLAALTVIPTFRHSQLQQVEFLSPARQTVFSAAHAVIRGSDEKKLRKIYPKDLDLARVVKRLERLLLPLGFRWEAAEERWVAPLDTLKDKLAQRKAQLSSALSWPDLQIGWWSTDDDAIHRMHREFAFPEQEPILERILKS